MANGGKWSVHIDNDFYNFKFKVSYRDYMNCVKVRYFVYEDKAKEFARRNNGIIEPMYTGYIDYYKKHGTFKKGDN